MQETLLSTRLSWSRVDLGLAKGRIKGVYASRTIRKTLSLKMLMVPTLHFQISPINSNAVQKFNGVWYSYTMTITDEGKTFIPPCSFVLWYLHIVKRASLWKNNGLTRLDTKPSSAYLLHIVFSKHKNSLDPGMFPSLNHILKSANSIENCFCHAKSFAVCISSSLTPVIIQRQKVSICFP